MASGFESVVGDGERRAHVVRSFDTVQTRPSSRLCKAMRESATELKRENVRKKVNVPKARTESTTWLSAFPPTWSRADWKADC